MREGYRSSAMQNLEVQKGVCEKDMMVGKLVICDLLHGIDYK
jgi:hypothetical protein